MSAFVIGTDLALPGRLHPVSLTLAVGSLTCLIGPNGSGKTSLLHALAGIGHPEGMVSIDGREIRHAAPQERIRLLSFLPASRDVPWPVPARDLVALGLPGGFDSGRIDQALALMDVGHLSGRRMDRLSTGERSRILIARAFAADARLLLLDEPTANLDPLWQLRLMDHLQSLVRNNGRTAVVALHDIDMAARYADRLMIMQEGRIAADGDAVELLASEQISAIFGLRRGPAGWRPLNSPEDPRSSP